MHLEFKPSEIIRVWKHSIRLVMKSHRVKKIKASLRLHNFISEQFSQHFQNRHPQADF